MKELPSKSSQTFAQATDTDNYTIKHLRRHKTTPSSCYKVTQRIMICITNMYRYLPAITPVYRKELQPSQPQSVTVLADIIKKCLPQSFTPKQTTPKSKRTHQRVNAHARTHCTQISHRPNTQIHSHKLRVILACSFRSANARKRAERDLLQQVIKQTPHHPKIK